MKNKKIQKLLFVLGIGLLVSASSVIFQKVKTVVANGLEVSKKIRVADNNSSSCETKQNTHFSGCNSVL
jgi:hypothetical protein